MKKRQLRTSTHRFGFGMLVSAVLLLAVATLAGCSKHDDDRLPGGKQPVSFTATMEEQGTTQAAKAATRATSDNKWTGGEDVAVQIGGVVKNYIVINYSDGTLIPNVTVQPFYWTSSSEQKSVSAWVPYSNTKPTQFTVKANQNYQNTALGYQQSDMIFASQTITFGNPSLTFRHLPAKVVVNIKNGKGITQADVQSATVTLLNQNLTSGAIATDWNVAQQTTPGSDAITPNVLTTATAGYQKTVQALLVPQTIAAGARMLQVSIGGSLFYYTPTAEQSLAAGEQYNYQITVNATGLSVTTQISDWTTEEVTGEAEMEGVPFGSKSASQAAIGDFYFSDGSLEDKAATLTVEQKAACVGIVYWLGDPTNSTNGDPLLKTQHSDCTHGLVVALHEAKNPLTNTTVGMNWSVSYEQVNDWTNSNDRGGNKVNITEENKLQGYANTMVLKAYNAQQNNADLKVLPIAAIEQYEMDYPAPAGSSGWYVPSVLELKYMCWGQGATSQSTTGRDLLNGQFDKVGGTNFDGSSYYWPSSEYADYSNLAWYVAFEIGVDNYYYKNDVEWLVRALFAF